MLILPFLVASVQAQATLNVTGIDGSFNMSSLGCGPGGGNSYEECIGGPQVGLAAQLIIRNNEDILYGTPSLATITYNGQFVSSRVIGVTTVGNATKVSYTASQLAIAFIEYGEENTTACINIPGSPEAIYAIQIAVATESLSETVWPSIPTDNFPEGTLDEAEILTACAGRDLWVWHLHTINFKQFYAKLSFQITAPELYRSTLEPKEITVSAQPVSPSHERPAWYSSVRKGSI